MPEQVAQLFRVEAGLLAFILAFYALCARERRAPYITHTVYSEIGLVLLAVFFTLLAMVSIPGHVWLVCAFQRVAQLLLLVATLATIKRVYYIANRDLRLRDDKWWQVLPLWKQYYFWTRRLKHARKSSRSYEHQSLSPSKELIDGIEVAGWPSIEQAGGGATSGGSGGGPGLSVTLALTASSYRATDVRSLRLAATFLQNNHYVQYTPCGRHPMEFVVKLKSHLKQDWEQSSGRVVVVDAYTPHFGFYDSVHETRTKYLQKELGVVVIPCRPTFAGIHTATARAFNLIKSQENGGRNAPRKPALLIFEATYALVDLESQEQYRRFVRHVIPSERMWGSMFTAFIELGLDEDNKALLESYADYFLDVPRAEYRDDGVTS